METIPYDDEWQAVRAARQREYELMVTLTRWGDILQVTNEISMECSASTQNQTPIVQRTESGFPAQQTVFGFPVQQTASGFPVQQTTSGFPAQKTLPGLSAFSTLSSSHHHSAFGMRRM